MERPEGNGARQPGKRRVFVRLTRDDGSLESIMADSTFRYAIHRASTPIYQEPLGEEIADVAPGTYRATAGCYAGDGADSWTEIAAARVEVVTGKDADVELMPLR